MTSKLLFPLSNDDGAFFFFLHQGMTNANMKLVILDVPLDGEMESPEQNLEAGETITRRTVEVAKLYSVLKGT